MATRAYDTSQPAGRIGRWLALFGLWAIPAVIFAGLSHVAMLRAGNESVFWQWLGGQLSAWWTWALFTPLIVWLGRRYPIDRRPRTRAVMVHTGASIMLGLMQLCIAAFASIRFHGEPSTWNYYVEQVVPFLMWRGVWAMMVYWAVLGVVYALQYRDNLSKRAVEVSQLESQVALARLDALQRQLQPHFLFNALNSISVLIRAQRTDDADRVLGDLSDLLRYVLKHQDEPDVSLREELTFTQRYADIERTRFGDRLEVTFDVPNHLLNARLPGFLLQSLVENAIRHGIAHSSGAGRVSVQVSEDHGFLSVSVSDNGAGLPDAQGHDDDGGIGLSNAHERLHFLYGQDYRLELNENDDGGATTSLTLPLNQREGESS